MAKIIDLDAARRARRYDAVSARVTLRAHERGVGAPFQLALARLVRHDGRSPGELETLAEAARAAGLSLDDVLDAAYDPRRDREIRRAR